MSRRSSHVWDGYDKTRVDVLEEKAKPARGQMVRKDTRKWCKGKVGVEHQVVVKREVIRRGTVVYSSKWEYPECSVCGKKFWPRLAEETK